MKQFRVSWTIDIDADTPEQAAAAVFSRYFRPGHEATVFQVTDGTNQTEIDLTAESAANAEG